MAVAIEERGDGSYSFRLWVTDKDGKRRRQRFTVKARSKREAQKEYIRIQSEVNSGAYTEPSKLTVAEHLGRWLQDYAAPNIGAKTLEDYTTIINNHINPTLGRIPLEKLASPDIQRFYREKRETLSASRVRLIHVVLNQAMTKAVKGRLLKWSPMDGVEPPKPPKHKTGNVYDAYQLNVLLDVSREMALAGKNSMHIPIVLASHTGMRLGEICALKWADVDLDASSVYVHRSLTHTKREGLQFKTTKNEDSRLIPLAPDATAQLRRHKAEQAQRRLLLGEHWQDHGLVCPNDDGTPRNPDQASHTFHDFIRRTTLPPIRFHDLRHTYASLLGRAKVDGKVIQECLGHKTSAITKDLYTHVFASARREAADVMERLLRKA